MAYHAAYDVFQQQLTEFHIATGRRMNYPEMSHILFNKNLVREGRYALRHSVLQKNMGDEEFIEQIGQRGVPVYPPEINSTSDVDENAIFPSALDVFLFRHFSDIANDPHTHDYFEIIYVFRGSCLFGFEKRQRELKEGELCIIAPNSLHSLDVPKHESVIVNLLIRKSTFNSTFFSLLSGNDLMSSFFRTTLYGDSGANYLLFYTENTDEIKNILKAAFLNNAVDDAYSNTCCISLTNILFSTILRNYSKTIQFYDYQMGTDFSLLLQYIQKNYLHLTLKELARMFHYSESYLSVLIKKNTGHSFSELIVRLKMADAMQYLLGTGMKIAEIAEVTGYNSADHFSRSFRQIYGVSPAQYRETKNAGGGAMPAVRE